MQGNRTIGIAHPVLLNTIDNRKEPRYAKLVSTSTNQQDLSHKLDS